MIGVADPCQLPVGPARRHSCTGSARARGTSTNRDGSNALRPRTSAGLTVMGSSTASTKSRWNSIPFRVPKLGKRLVGGRDADEGAVSEAVGESQLSDMELGIELVAAPAIAGLVQVSADVEIDQALPTRLDGSDLLANGNDVAVDLLRLKGHEHFSGGWVGEHAEHHLLDVSLDRLGFDPDPAAAPVAGKASDRRNWQRRSPGSANAEGHHTGRNAGCPRVDTCGGGGLCGEAWAPGPP